MVELTNHYYRDVDGEYAIGRFGFTSGGATTGFLALPVPATQVEWLTTEGTTWLGLTLLTPSGSIEMRGPAVVYEPGSSADEPWVHRPIRPAVPPDWPAPSRLEDTMSIGVLTFVDPAGTTASPTRASTSRALTPSRTRCRRTVS